MAVVPFSELRINAALCRSTSCELLDQTAVSVTHPKLAPRILRLVEFPRNIQDTPGELDMEHPDPDRLHLDERDPKHLDPELMDTEQLDPQQLDTENLDNELLDPEELVPGKRCNVMKIFNSILEASAPHLAELSVITLERGLARVGQFTSPLHFPNLKVLTFYTPCWGHRDDQPVYRNFLNGVVKNAPKSERYHWDHLCERECEISNWCGFKGDYEDMWLPELEGRQALFVMNRPSWDDIPMSMSQQLAVQWIQLSFNNPEPEGYSVILRNSRTTLRKAWLFLSYVEQILLDGLPYPELLLLHLDIDFSVLRDKYKALLKAPAWRECFPTVNELYFCLPNASPYEDEEDEQRKTAERESMDRLMTALACRSWFDEEVGATWPEIERISIHGLGLGLSTGDCAFIGRLFPNVKCLLLLYLPVQAILPSFFWTMEHLEQLHLNYVEYGQSIDGALGGILDEEVAELKKMGTNDLSAVHIVPIRPPVTWLRGECKSIRDN